MRVVHGDRELAATVEFADSLIAKMRGLRFRDPLPEGHALVFPFRGVAPRDIDMLFVRAPIDVLWLVDDTVRRVETLRPWRGFAVARADTVVELPAGAASAVAPGDPVRVESDDG